MTWEGTLDVGVLWTWGYSGSGDGRVGGVGVEREEIMHRGE